MTISNPPSCGTTINVSIQTVRVLTTLMAPFLPFTAATCLEMLQLDEDALGEELQVVWLPSTLVQTGAATSPPERAAPWQ